jgi:hypothetical protein
MAKSDIPPVPPAGRSPKGPGDAGTEADPGKSDTRRVPENLAEQDRQGNINQNTKHQGHQQDR